MLQAFPSGCFIKCILEVEIVWCWLHFPSSREEDNVDTLSTMLLYETPSIELSTKFRENLESRPEIGMLVYLITNGFG